VKTGDVGQLSDHSFDIELLDRRPALILLSHTPPRLQSPRIPEGYVNRTQAGCWRRHGRGRRPGCWRRRGRTQAPTWAGRRRHAGGDPERTRRWGRATGQAQSRTPCRSPSQLGSSASARTSAGSAGGLRRTTMVQLREVRDIRQVAYSAKYGAAASLLILRQ
jgi:hypothetical protein